MKYLLPLLLFPSVALADVCDFLGTYSFALVGCPNFNPSIDLSIPLCEQEELKHLAFLDARCYQEVKYTKCYEWDCQAPYDRVMMEPLSGRVVTWYGTREAVDWEYRAARWTVGELLKKQKRRK